MRLSISGETRWDDHNLARSLHLFEDGERNRVAPELAAQEFQIGHLIAEADAPAEAFLRVPASVLAHASGSESRLRVPQARD